MSEQPELAGQPASQNDPLPGEEATTGLSLARIAGLALIGIAAVLAIYLVVLYFALQSGQNLRQQNLEIAQTEQIERQLSLARADVDAGNWTLARRRLEWILERAPGQPEASAMQQQVENESGLLATAVAPTAAPTAAVTPEPATTPAAGEPRAELQRLRRLSAEEEWSAAIVALESFQRQYPSYERQATDKLLYEAYVELGVELLYTPRVELGIYYLEQAEALGDLDQSVLDQRLWAELYLEGIAYYGVNWAVSTAALRELCLSAPFYQSSCELQHDALVAYADQLAAAFDWCPAEGAYREASQLQTDRSLSDRLQEASAACLAATPTLADADGLTPAAATTPAAGSPDSSPPDQ